MPKDKKKNLDKATEKVKANTKVRKRTLLGQLLGSIFFGADAGKEY